jgi:hypothetical protein
MFLLTAAVTKSVTGSMAAWVVVWRLKHPTTVKIPFSPAFLMVTNVGLCIDFVIGGICWFLLATEDRLWWKSTS